MKELKENIYNLLLKPKKVRLLEELVLVATGDVASFTPFLSNPQYYEIWFYTSFDFKYIVLGKENYVINLGDSTDNKRLSSLLENYDSEISLTENKINQITKQCEFDFFANCWEELEQIINKEIRGFLIEYGIIRGWDLNNKVPVDGEEIGKILTQEGIQRY